MDFRSWISKGLEEILVDDDIAEDTLVISVKYQDSRRSTASVISVDSSPFDTRHTYIEIQTVKLAPEPPRNLRGMLSLWAGETTGKKRDRSRFVDREERQDQIVRARPSFTTCIPAHARDPPEQYVAVGGNYSTASDGRSYPRHIRTK